MQGKPFSEDAARGMLLGLAVGDALGAERAGGPPHTVPAQVEMTGGGPHALAPGQWTDETAQAMCLAQMLRSANGWDAEDAMKRLVNWRDYGYLSATRVCFGMDSDVAAALRRFEATRNPYAGHSDGDGGESERGAAGVTRVAPVALAYGGAAESAMAVAQLQCRLTHAGPLCQRAAANIAKLLVTGDRGLLPRPDAAPEHVGNDVMQVLHGAFWALDQGDGFEAVMRAALGLTGDVDRVAALVGQIAGRVHGASGIPERWRASLWDHDKIATAAADLYAMRPIDV